jgi:ABC-type antimicrobial peptide transport system permease subunit
LGRGVALAGGGAVGLRLAAAAAQVARGVLYGVGPHDPITLVIVTMVLLVTAALACIVPAHRALRVEPIAALRAD